MEKEAEVCFQHLAYYPYTIDSTRLFEVISRQGLGIVQAEAW